MRSRFTEWPQAHVNIMISTLRRFTVSDYDEALKEISKVLGVQVTSPVIRAVFLRRKLGSPTSYCQKSSEVASATQPAREQQPPRDPEKMLEDKASVIREKRLKAEVDSLLDKLREANTRAKFVEEVSYPDIPILERREPLSGLREGTMIVLASDWHVEEKVDPQAIAGINEYNLEIAEHRAHRFFNGVEWLLNFNRQAFAIRDLILWLGGDFYSGYIHDELVETSQLSPVESILFLRTLLTGGIKRLLTDTELERVVIPCSYGNHGRLTEKRRISTGAENSLEWLLYQIMKDDFRDDPRVSFTADKSAHQYVGVYGETLHFHHGDDVNFYGNVGGLSIPLNKRVPMWDRVKESKIHHIGHYHQFLDLGHTVANGSLIGYNAYAQSKGYAPEPPQQAAYMLDAKRGKCLVTPLWVD